MKSQVNALLHVVEGILKDTVLTYPELKGSLSKDFDRLTLNCRNRGLGLFTLDLPKLDSLLLRGLEDGRLQLEGPLSTAVSSKAKVPRLFSGLWLRIFDKSSCLKHEVDCNALFFLRSLLTLGKRLEVDCSDDRKSTKVGEYHAIERSLRPASFDWQGDYLQLRSSGGNCPKYFELLSSRDRDHNSRDLYYSDLFPSTVSEESEQHLGDGTEEPSSELANVERDHMSVHLVQCVDHVYPSLNRPFDLFSSENREEEGRDRLRDIRILNQIQRVADLIFARFRPLDVISFSAECEENALGVGFKHGPGAVSERLKQHEKSCFPNWPNKLQNTFPYEYCGKTIGSPTERPLNHEMYARLAFVPKDARSPRLVASEPVAHQWCQQLLLRYFFEECRRNFGSAFIDFKDQGKSADMVLKASLDRELATVDLSDASDRLSCWTVERVFRGLPSVLRALHAARTRYIREELTGIPNFLSLRKFAAQGTATTFPVMSLVMLCIAIGCTFGEKEDITWRRIWNLRTRVRVFGDDIILPTHGYQRLLRAMDLLQLKVNVAKSYVNGHFRESCGMDAYMGCNITPTRPKTIIADSPASCKAVVDTSNNLFNKGLWYASDSARDLIPISVREYLRIVGRKDAGFSGLSSFSGSDECHLVSRWNTRLHRHEVRVWNLSDQTRRTERDGFDALLDFFSRAHSKRNPRAVSEFIESRRQKSRLLWEPQNTHARVPHRHVSGRSRRKRSS